jgi:hypothetical protein
MTGYENQREMGFYREETGLVIASAVTQRIDTSAPVASNTHADQRNYTAHGSDTYTLGVRYIEVTTCTHGGAHDGAFLAVNISSVTGANITLNANTWDNDTVTVGYYARGTGTTSGTRGIQDSDIWRPEHPDAILKAINSKGNLNPIDSGLIYDQCMCHRRGDDTITAGDGNKIVVDSSGGHSVGTWSFDNTAPFYVVAVRVEVLASDMDTTKGLELKLWVDGSQHSASILLNDTNNWMMNEYNDTVSTWYSANVFLGMLLCTNFKVTLGLYNGNGTISLNSWHVWVSGWHRPDLLDDETDISYTYFETPTPSGNYREEIFTATSALAVVPNPRCACSIDPALRTNPHYLREFRHGVEFAENLTNGDFITASIVKVTDTKVYFDGQAIAQGDKIRLGYYAHQDNAATNLSLSLGDMMYGGIADGLCRGVNRMDRIDFGDGNFPYGTGEYQWHYALFKMSWVAAYYQTQPIIGGNWRTILQFDPTNYNSRVMDTMFPKNTEGLLDDYYFDARSDSGIDETPFFITGFFFETEGDSISGSARYNNPIEFSIVLNGSKLRQGTLETIKYHQMATAFPVEFTEFFTDTSDTLQNFRVPAANYAETIDVHDGGGPFFYLPIGMVRCYNFEIKARIKPGEAMTEFGMRQGFIEGWMIRNV